MSYVFEQDEMREEAAATMRRRIFWGVAFFAGLSVAGYYILFAPKKAPVKRSKAQITMVSLPPPPPPPPPKKEPEPPKPEEKMEEPQEQEMVMQEPVVEDEPQPAEAPAEAPAADIGTGIAGDGPPDAFGLSTRGSGMRIGGGGGIGGKASRYGWYAAQVQRRVSAILRAHPLLRAAEFRSTNVRIYADNTGRAVRISLDSTGDPKIDQAIRDALTGVQVTDALVGDRPIPPMPIVMRLKAVRPN